MEWPTKLAPACRAVGATWTDSGPGQSHRSGPVGPRLVAPTFRVAGAKLYLEVAPGSYPRDQPSGAMEAGYFLACNLHQTGLLGMFAISFVFYAVAAHHFKVFERTHPATSGANRTEQP